jgi:LemA protein
MKEENERLQVGREISDDRTRMPADTLKTSGQNTSDSGNPGLRAHKDPPQPRKSALVWGTVLLTGILMAFSISHRSLFFLGLLVLMTLGGLAAGCLVGYTMLSRKAEEVRQTRALAQNEIDRKAALIPRLQEIVYDYAHMEMDTVMKTTQARAHKSEAFPAGVMPGVEPAAEFRAIFENYPQMRSNQVFIGLLEELTEAENRITAMVKEYNRKAGRLNGLIESFPLAAVADFFGISKAEYMET